MLQRHDLREVNGGYAEVLPRPLADTDEPLAAVRSIIDQVRVRGDDAVVEFGARFDGAPPTHLRIPPEQIQAALDRIEPSLRDSLEQAAASILAFHQSVPTLHHQHDHNGMRVTARRQPVDRAGCYVPGGRAAYPSTVLMTALPARAAGVDQVVVCVPPGSDGQIADVTLAAAAICGVDEVYAMGGAQAIAAMAYGTDSVAAVDVIVGPGNVYVALAKREVAGLVGVPSAFAGPSEICVVADAAANPAYVAIDLIVQAEHGPDGVSWLITDDPTVADAVDVELERLIATNHREADIRATMSTGGHVAIVRDADQAIAVANVIAPEHLQLMVADAAELVDQVRHAGAVFIGEQAPASLGDYIAGPSHVLPTNGTARFGGALGIEDFCKHIHIVEVDDRALEWAGPHVAMLAAAEGLQAHADSVRMRLAELGHRSHVASEQTRPAS